MIAGERYVRGSLPIPLMLPVAGQVAAGAESARLGTDGARSIRSPTVPHTPAHPPLFLNHTNARLVGFLFDARSLSPNHRRQDFPTDIVDEHAVEQNIKE